MDTKVSKHRTRYPRVSEFICLICSSVVASPEVHYPFWIASLGVAAPYFSAGLSVAAAVAVPSLCTAAPVVVSSLGVSPVGVAFLFPFVIASLGVARRNFFLFGSSFNWCSTASRLVSNLVNVPSALNARYTPLSPLLFLPVRIQCMKK